MKEVAHKSKHKGIVYFTTTVGSYRYLRVYSEANGCDIIRFNKQVRSVKEMMRYFEYKLAEFDWSYRLSNADIQARQKWRNEVHSDIYLDSYGFYVVQCFDAGWLDVESMKDSIQEENRVAWFRGFERAILASE
jgi:hypothetical protein